MTGGAGHISDMIGRIRSNQNINSKRGNYFKNRQAYLKTTRGDKVNFRKLTKEELKIIRQKVIRERQRVAFINFSVIAISLIGLVLFLVWMFV